MEGDGSRGLAQDLQKRYAGIVISDRLVQGNRSTIQITAHSQSILLEIEFVVTCDGGGDQMGRFLEKMYRKQTYIQG